MERACANGAVEAAERLFESYRTLFADYNLHKCKDNNLPKRRASDHSGMV
jgi:hypothetical protein